ncbi:ABC transporter substrate-binding protein [Amycolatopsis mediterranei S699]|uniref:ABC transport system substrate-binding protein n=2 Tax=Amycolatopsis mediterranei TaxID=33910 RepID=A0A0H3DIU4_AMYMU|nr:ABC transporter substrate-binding protein [Amycolatopsis mediterranei]ADJ50755.1 ABC transport system substrate-binding protein [Amycolatopsis mediterranei U32]AEK47765.1 ABC transporter substrate-binding protein [Amycolatopsis mediterranei S699]AFO82461.1 ABC transporter substrate-binding protein [Amycolatopsis mediterranei S699]AGT89590.1 ABC transporter substrate-binding protein [Amycolatopsis mediterranei RB]KDO12251.1 ABC transporter substrate-binding protein [Amycolatopsis mediterrane
MRSTLSKIAAAVTAGALTLTLAACGGSDAGPATLRVGTLSDAPPSIYLENGRFTGYDNELLRDIAKREGFEVEFVGTEFSSLLAGVAGGKFDIGSSTISSTEARKKTVAFSNGYNTGFTTVVTAKGANLKDTGALGGKRLGVVQGSVQDEFAGKVAGAQVVRFPDYNAGFAQLKNGTLDGWVVPQDIGQKYLDQNPNVPLELGYTVEDKDTPSAFAVAKKNTELLNKLNDGLAKAVADGTVARIYGQFYKNTPLSKELQQGGPGLTVKNLGA